MIATRRLRIGAVHLWRPVTPDRLDEGRTACGAAGRYLSRHQGAHHEYQGFRTQRRWPRDPIDAEFVSNAARVTCRSCLKAAGPDELLVLSNPDRFVGVTFTAPRWLEERLVHDARSAGMSLGAYIREKVAT